MTNSPLGQYAPAVAAIVALAVVGSWLLSEMLKGMGIFTGDSGGLENMALLAIGAVLGSAVAVNGYKAPLAAAHKRLDAMGAPSAENIETAHEGMANG